MITARDFSFQYPHADRKSLESITFELHNGENLGILGPSGAGKTTLAYAISGVLQRHFPGGHASGSLAVTNSDSGYASIGFVFQNVHLQMSGMTETVEDEIAFSLGEFGLPRAIIRERVREQLEVFHLSHLSDRNPRTLSGGETQMLAVACEAAKHPSLFLVDEPATSLNSSHVKNLLVALKKMNGTVVFIDHSPDNLLPVCDKILVLEDGKAKFFGPADELFTENTDLSSIDLPAWIEVQGRLGRSSVSRTYKESLQWLRKYRISA